MANTSRQIFDLTFALFRVTDRFPAHAHQERLAIRDQAYRILKTVMGFSIDIGHYSSDVNVRELEIEIKALAKELRGLETHSPVNPVNLKVLEREYTAFLDSIRVERPPAGLEFEKQPTPSRSVTENRAPLISNSTLASGQVFFRSRAVYGLTLNSRKRQILDHLKEIGPANVRKLAEILPDAPSLRTIQRDLNSLLESKAVIRLSGKRWTRYAPNLVVLQKD